MNKTGIFAYNSSRVTIRGPFSSFFFLVFFFLGFWCGSLELRYGLMKLSVRLSGFISCSSSQSNSWLLASIMRSLYWRVYFIHQLIRSLQSGPNWRDSSARYDISGLCSIISPNKHVFSNVTVIASNNRTSCGGNVSANGSYWAACRMICVCCRIWTIKSIMFSENHGGHCFAEKYSHPTVY